MDHGRWLYEMMISPIEPITHYNNQNYSIKNNYGHRPPDKNTRGQAWSIVDGLFGASDRRSGMIHIAAPRGYPGLKPPGKSDHRPLTIEKPVVVVRDDDFSH